MQGYSLGYDFVHISFRMINWNNVRIKIYGLIHGELWVTSIECAKK